jgi:O-antigen/teichoic acid export membrane protein
MAFPILARTAGEEAVSVLRARMIQLLSVLLFPLLALLALLAPVLIPAVFGPAWEDAVLPAQILTIGGAATLTIDGVGSALQAAGRATAMLGYGVAHFACYVAAVFIVLPYGLAAVAAAAAGVHALFLIVAYWLLLRGRLRHALRVLWDDLAAALVGCGALLAAAWPLQVALEGAGVPGFVTIVLVGAAGGAAYLVAIRLAFPAAWRDLGATVGRVLPHRLVARRTAAAAPGA